MADVFVSYVRKDRAVAERLSHGLQKNGISVWWDRHIAGGSEFAKEIERELGSAKSVVVLWSTVSVDSDWVRDEAAHGRDTKKLIPICIDGVRPPLGFRQVQVLDWTGEGHAGELTDVVASVRRVVDRATTDATPVIPRETRRPRVATRRRMLAAAALLMAVVVVATVAMQRVRVAPSIAPAVGNARIEINVFEPLADDAQMQRFSRQLGDTLMRVFAANDLKAVAQVQGGVGGNRLAEDAEFILRGTVDRDGAQYVVSSDLLHHGEALVLWSMTRQRLDTELRPLQENFASSVAGVLKCALVCRTGMQNDSSSELFSKLLRVCEAFQDGSKYGHALELTRQLVEVAPQYALSYGLYAGIAARATLGVPPAERDRLRKVVEDNAAIALQKDPNTTVAYAALAIVDDPTRSQAEREQLLKKVMALAPGQAGNQILYPRFLLNVGRTREALFHFERVSNEDPLDMMAQRVAAYLTAQLGNIELARQKYDAMRSKRMTDAETDASLADAELWYGDPKRALALMAVPDARAEMTDPCFRRFVDARARGIRLTEQELNVACPDGAAEFFAHFGYVDGFYRAVNARKDYPESIFGREALFEPDMRSVRADPRFMPFAQRRGLVDYWLDTNQWPDFCADDKLPYDCREAALAAREHAKKAARAVTNTAIDIAKPTP